MQLIQLKLNNNTVHQVTEANVADLLFENYKMLVKKYDRWKEASS